MQKSVLAAATVAATVSMSAQALELDLTFERLWTHRHEAQFSEIPAFDAKTNTVWVAGGVGIDVLDAKTGELVEHLDVTPYGLVNSVAIHNGLAALAVEASPDRRVAGSVLFFDTRTRALTSGVNQVTVGSLPDMLTFTADGRKLLVANEATPNAVADAPYTPARGRSRFAGRTERLSTTAAVCSTAKRPCAASTTTRAAATKASSPRASRCSI